MPVQHAKKAEGDQRQQGDDTSTPVQALGDRRSEKRHKGNAHRQAIPQERSVAGSQMVVGRAEADQRHRKEEDLIRQRIGRTHERLLLGVCGEAEHDAESPQSHQQKGQVGDHVQAMGNAQQGALIGELVIGEVLRNGRLQENDHPEGDRQVGNYPEAVVAFHLYIALTRFSRHVL